MIVRPAGYSSDEYSDDDGLEYIGESIRYDKPRVTELTEDQRRENVLEKLRAAAMKGNVEETVQILDEHRIQIDIQFNDQWTPLLLAASVGNAQLAKVLIDRGADINQSLHSVTVLMHACNVSTFNSNYTEIIHIVEYLLEKKVDVNAIDRRRLNACMYAAENGHVEVVKRLLPFIDKHAVDNQGWNILFFAVNENHYDLTKYLLKVGLDYKKTDVRGNSVLDYARMRNFVNIFDLIPNPESKRKHCDLFISNDMEYNNEIVNPRFMRDVNVMLLGMQSESLLDKFNEDTSMCLEKFLTLTRNDLLAMDITMPYQQNRILSGLYCFHMYPYLAKATPFVAKKKIITTHDISFLALCAIRHYITMKSSLIYLQNNANDWNVDEMSKLLEKLQEKVKVAQTLSKRLQRKAVQWDKENRRVDLIIWPPKKSTLHVFKYILPIAIAVCISGYFKFRL